MGDGKSPFGEGREGMLWCLAAAHSHACCIADATSASDEVPTCGNNPHTTTLSSSCGWDVSVSCELTGYWTNVGIHRPPAGCWATLYTLKTTFIVPLSNLLRWWLAGKLGYGSLLLDLCADAYRSSLHSDGIERVGLNCAMMTHSTMF